MLAESKGMIECACGCGQRRRCRVNGKVRRYITGHRGRTHGCAGRGARTKTYQSWYAMKARCLNPKNTKYEYYGGRGITVCDRWMTFENFLADMGERPEGKSIERIDNNRNYEPSNCCWIDRKLQQGNTSKNTFITHEGRTMTLAQWARHLGVPYYRVLYRILKGQSLGLIRAGKGARAI